ncbi:MAG TPA: DUF4142 domain-containing protein [Puia sp.]|nr:DUF4142 domain-containing protein [Puia sp.]
MSKIWVPVALLALFVIACSKKSSSGTSLDAADQQFVTSAGYHNVDEINAGYLASTNAADSAVKKFAMKMVDDYGAAHSALILVADSFHFAVVSSPDSAYVLYLNQLSNLKATTFDTTYLRGQINDDQAAISLYQAEQSKGGNAAIKAYANTYLPMIQAHLSAADSLLQAGH